MESHLWEVIQGCKIAPMPLKRYVSTILLALFTNRASLLEIFKLEEITNRRATDTNFFGCDVTRKWMTQNRGSRFWLFDYLPRKKGPARWCDLTPESHLYHKVHQEMTNLYKNLMVKCRDYWSVQNDVRSKNDDVRLACMFSQFQLSHTRSWLLPIYYPEDDFQWEEIHTNFQLYSIWPFY